MATNIDLTRLERALAPAGVTRLGQASYGQGERRRYLYFTAQYKGQQKGCAVMITAPAEVTFESAARLVLRRIEIDRRGTKMDI